MYKVRIQLFIPDDHGEDIITSIEVSFHTMENCLTFVRSEMNKGRIQAVRVVSLNG